MSSGDGDVSDKVVARQRVTGGQALIQRLLAACLVLVVILGVLVGVGLGSHSDTSAAVGASTLPPPAPITDLSRSVDPTSLIADPTVLVGRRVDYMYASESNRRPPYIPVRTFSVLGHWLSYGDAMPTLPPWAAPWVWNPDVRKVGSRYVMWFSAAQKGVALPVTGAMPRCLGWATSTSPLGPFIPSPTPAVCQLDQFGAIDPRTMIGPDGQEWLYWKSDDNAVLTADKHTVIWAQRLAANGTTLVGQATDILENTQPWEGRVVESPQMEWAHGHYYLFFSGNTSGSIANGVGMAPCRGPAGPCDNAAPGAWLGPSSTSASAGEESLYTQNGRTWLLFSPGGLAQTMAVARVAFGPAGPYVAAFHHLPSVG